jgi:hypothetical protein
MLLNMALKAARDTSGAAAQDVGALVSGAQHTLLPGHSPLNVAPVHALLAMHWPAYRL